jgi:hypothetical protein
MPFRQGMMDRSLSGVQGDADGWFSQRDTIVTRQLPPIHQCRLECGKSTGERLKCAFSGGAIYAPLTATLPA